MAKKVNHTHKLRKYKYPTGGTVLFCILPDCHYKVEAQFALGKKTLCNICGEEFLMTERQLKLKRPHCENCGKVAVSDADGNKYYVKKVANKILGSIGTNSVEDLQARLANLSKNEADEDI